MIMILNMFILCLLIFLYIFPAWLLDRTLLAALAGAAAAECWLLTRRLLECWARWRTGRPPWRVGTGQEAHCWAGWHPGIQGSSGRAERSNLTKDKNPFQTLRYFYVLLYKRSQTDSTDTVHPRRVWLCVSWTPGYKINSCPMKTELNRVVG